MDKKECIPMLKALADGTRWRLVSELLKAPRTVSELTERLGVTQYIEPKDWHPREYSLLLPDS